MDTGPPGIDPAGHLTSFPVGVQSFLSDRPYVTGSIEAELGFQPRDEVSCSCLSPELLNETCPPKHSRAKNWKTQRKHAHYKTQNWALSFSSPFRAILFISYFIPTFTAVSTLIQVLLVLPLITGLLELTTGFGFLEVNPHLLFFFHTQLNLALALVGHPSLGQPSHWSRMGFQGYHKRVGMRSKKAEPGDNSFPPLTPEPKVTWRDDDLEVILKARLPETVSPAAPWYFSTGWGQVRSAGRSNSFGSFSYTWSLCLPFSSPPHLTTRLPPLPTPVLDGVKSQVINKLLRGFWSAALWRITMIKGRWKKIWKQN